MGKELRQAPANPPKVLYKGKPYLQLWRGPSAFGKGERAHLQFLNGNGDFWVDASLTYPEGTHLPKRICRECKQPFNIQDCKTNEGDWEASYCGC